MDKGATMDKDRFIIREILGKKVIYDRDKDIIYTETVGKSDYIYKRTPMQKDCYDICIEITNACNLFCYNCFSDSKPHSPSSELSYSKIMDIIEAKKGSKIRVSITGGGPFLHSQINNIITIPSFYPDLNFVITSNGQNINSHQIELLYKNDWLLALSIHGRKDTHNNYTRSNSYDNLIHTLKSLPNEIRTHIYSLVTTFTKKEDIQHMLWVCDFYKVNFLRFILPRASGRYSIDYDQEIVEYIKEIKGEKFGLKVSKSNTEFITVNGVCGSSN